MKFGFIGAGNMAGAIIKGMTIGTNSYNGEDIFITSKTVTSAQKLADACGAVAVSSAAEVVQESDVLIDGPFILAERSLELKFRGSRNQRIIDVKKSLAAGEIVPWEEFKLDLPEGPTTFGGI